MGKTTKKLAAIFLAFILVIGAVPITGIDFSMKASAAENGLSFELNDDGNSYSVFCDGETLAGDLVIPATYNGKPVTKIDTDAFYDCTGLVSVVIPSSVTSIGYEAFVGCTSLASIVIPSSVTSIGSDAFYDTAYYNNASNWVGGVLYICGCLIVANEDINGSCAIADGTRLIADLAFAYDEELISVTIPSSVTSIGDWAFLYCTSLTSITVDEANENYKSVDGVLLSKDGTRLIKYPSCHTGTSYIIDDSVTSIIDSAFDNCTSLASITLPDSVTSIGDWAFENCASLASITLPDSVTSIGISAFNGCTSLVSITLPDSVTSIGELTFGSCTSLASIVIPSNVTIIGDSAFFNCRSLTPIVIPSNVISIGIGAFEGCTSLASITLPDSVTSIGNWAFNGCTSLASITLGDNVTSIGDSAFENCSLASITLPDSVTSIGDWAFYGCTSLASITLGDNVTSIGTGAFAETAYYFDHDNWQPCSGYCENAFLFIGNYLICANDCLGDGGGYVNYTIPDGTTLIADSAFQDCYCLTSLSIPSSVTSIGDLVFANCTNLASVVIPSSVTSIGYMAFSGCTNLVSLDIPSSVTSIGDWSFEDCTSLASIVIPSSVTSIGYSAFINCTSLASITIPSSVTSIDNWSFANCPALSDVYYGGTESEKALISIHNFEDNNSSLINAAWHYLSDITVNPAGTKTSYYVGDIPMAELKASYTDGKTNLFTGGFTCAPAKFSTSGAQTVTISYSGKSCTFTATVIVAPEKVSDVLSIQAPSKTTVKYGDTLILHANVGNLPDGAKVVWDVQGNGVILSPADDGTVCDVTSVENGKVTVTATVVCKNGETLKDASGNKVSVSQELNSKAGFFWRFISFIKNVLGIGRIIFQSIEAK